MNSETLTSMWEGEAYTSSSASGISIHVSGTHDITRAPSTVDPSNWCCLKPIERFSKLSIQISSVVIVNKFWVVAKDDNSGGTNTDLIAIIYLGLGAISPCRGWLPQYRPM